ncbi:3-dehydroquinate synthase [Hyphobacterium marinum]|uniref:3-dehydroquinate synthase n=1 Tax=Hyphobacterium marinum TaxID=3116574 RepID=A0ABU7LXI9_9PROT|nr:3-dehydroquinate synthase [Hyphobacterium sp. Y6023]MEE2566255.1 3-dehydroquinate synthase [Hyphobacterium sp. Y6023]
MSGPDIIPVATATGAYDVIAGAGALEAAATRFQEMFPRGEAIIVTDTNVAGLHLDRVRGALRQVGIECEPVIAAPGEGQKSFSGIEALTDALAHAGVERGDTIIALGGGVVGDLTGFAAAIYKRGIGFVQMPTTLLAQADSSVGGKTGINTRAGKNMVGAFHPPRLVVADAAFLDTLPKRELRAGYAEILKAALIGDAALFDRLEAAGDGIYTPETLQPALTSAIRFKAGVVARDEKEAGERALLNLGHTFGHAFEAEAPGQMTHGEAVAAGLALAFRYSAQRGDCPQADADRVAAHLRTAGLPDGPDAVPGGPFDAARLVDRMRHDKKNSGGTITLVLARSIGDAFIAPGMDANDIERFLKSQMT